MDKAHRVVQAFKEKYNSLPPEDRKNYLEKMGLKFKSVDSGSFAIRQSSGVKITISGYKGNADKNGGELVAEVHIPRAAAKKTGKEPSTGSKLVASSSAFGHTRKKQASKNTKAYVRKARG